MRLTSYLSLFAASLMLTATQAWSLSPEASKVFDVPRLTNIAIDGKVDDWGDDGFRVDLLCGPTGQYRPPADFDPRFRLGWDDRGLLVLVTVRDDVVMEQPELEKLASQDAVEVFVNTHPGDSELWQATIGPGLDPNLPGPRHYLRDYRSRQTKDAVPHLDISAASAKTQDGYVMELLLPWKNLNIEPKEDMELAIQIFVNDYDKDGELLTAVWYPARGIAEDTSKMYKIRLAKQPGPPVQARARGYYSGPCTVFEVIGSSESQGRKVTFVAAGKQIAQGVLQHRDGRPALWILQPISTSEEKLKAEVLLDGSPVTMIVLPPAAQGRARAMVDEPVARQLFCFGTKEFPSLDFERPLEVQCLLCGPYTVQTTYYDAGFNKVTTAEKPGRYGAIMEVKTEDGRTLRRFRTLYRTPGRAKWWDSEMKVSIELDENLGIKPKTAQRFSDDLSGYVRSRFYSGLYDDPDMAVLLAGLSEAREEGGQPTPAENPWSVDQQWWVTMKRKLYGTDKEFPNPFVCPRPLEGQPARVVHEGTLEEAGMSDEGVAGIDAVCKKWAADSDEAFAVCIVRHGVIAFHKAYGRRNGKDMTVDTPSRMASITKLISGTTMMLAIDQGLVGLDETVDKYLPPFRGIQVANPLTVRHLYTHTSGLWGHWGAELNDFEELLAEYYPSLDVGKRFDYNGAGFDLGGKILEAVSGESMENFYGNHLLEPLGCGMNTTVKDGGGGAMSIPLDMARIGQMLLNRGAYGDKRFFSEASFEQMLPKPLNAVFKIEPTTREYGIGVSWETDKNILPKDTFGHGAASSATFRVIPSQDMVIVMCRNSAGANFDVYHPEFLKSVLEAVQDRATTQQN